MEVGAFSWRSGRKGEPSHLPFVTPFRPLVWLTRFPFGQMETLSLRPSITTKRLKLPGTLEEKLVLTDVEAKSGTARVGGNGLLFCFRNGVLALKLCCSFSMLSSPPISITTWQSKALVCQVLVYWQRGAVCLWVATTTAGFFSNASVVCSSLQVKRLITL